MGDPETVPEPSLHGEPLTNPKPDDTPNPVVDPTIPELQDRRRPKP